MPASDSDDEPPEGGWYVKTGDPTSLLRERKAAAAAAAGKPRRRSSVGGQGLMGQLSTRRRGESRAAVSNVTATGEHAHQQQPEVTVIENPDIAAIPVKGLFRRRTAPTRRGNKEDEETIRKRAEKAVRDLGKAP
jgi:hypothetical protein